MPYAGEPRTRGTWTMSSHRIAGRAAALMVLGLLTLSMFAAPAVGAAGAAPCRVHNLTQETGSSRLRSMVEAARDGDELTVRGMCTGGIVVGVDIVIRGVGRAATITGRDRVRVL